MTFVQPLTIAYISEASPQDRHAWSGTVHYTFTSLCQAGFKVIPLGPARPAFWRLVLGGLNQVSLNLFKKRIDYRHSVVYSKAFGRIFSNKLKKITCDLVLVCGSTECGAYIKTDRPIYYVLDRTIAGALNYHEILSGLWYSSRQQSVFTDRKAMLEAKKLIFSSDWAASHAREFYGVSPTKIAVFPFGANLDSIPSREQVLKEKTKSSWNLLFIGTDWKNKGADILLNAFKILKEKKVPVKLTIVGCTPPEKLDDPDITNIPFIDKNSNDGLRRMTELFNNNHLFILPTRFDCTPIVFCEASGFGLPILSADTGGVRGHVHEGKNGYLIPYDDKGELYAKRIHDLFHDHAAYESLRKNSRDLYETSLNWTAWGKKFTELTGSAANQ